jgi:hypothetical protein
MLVNFTSHPRKSESASLRGPAFLREHLAASRYLLGIVPLNEVHFFMDASARRHGGGHRLIRHNFNTARFMRDYYAGRGGDLAHQAFLEVMVHIAFDAGLILPPSFHHP